MVIPLRQGDPPLDFAVSSDFLILMNAVNLCSPQDFSAFLRQCINGSIYFTRHYNGATTQSTVNGESYAREKFRE